MFYYTLKCYGNYKIKLLLKKTQRRISYKGESYIENFVKGFY